MTYRFLAASPARRNQHLALEREKNGGKLSKSLPYLRWNSGRNALLLAQIARPAALVVALLLAAHHTAAQTVEAEKPQYD